MPRAIFSTPFNYSSRLRNAGWAIEASKAAQSFPREVIDAAVKAGVAKEVPRQKAGQKGKSPKAED